MAKEHLLVSDKLRVRFMQHVDRQGPTHPYDSALGPCHIWTSGLSRIGYGNFTVMVGNKGERREATFRAHRIALALTGKVIPARKVVMHSCDNRQCVNPAHLRIGTRSQNSQEMADRGRTNFQLYGAPHGEKAYGAKLTEEDVLAILRDSRPRKEIAAHYSVTPGQISHIKTGRSWKHLRMQQIHAPSE